MLFSDLARCWQKCMQEVICHFMRFYMKLLLLHQNETSSSIQNSKVQESKSVRKLANVNLRNGSQNLRDSMMFRGTTGMRTVAAGWYASFFLNGCICALTKESTAHRVWWCGVVLACTLFSLDAYVISAFYAKQKITSRFFCFIFVQNRALGPLSGLLSIIGVQKLSQPPSVARANARSTMEMHFFMQEISSRTSILCRLEAGATKSAQIISCD